MSLGFSKKRHIVQYLLESDITLRFCSAASESIANSHYQLELQPIFTLKPAIASRISPKLILAGFWNNVCLTTLGQTPQRSGYRVRRVSEKGDA